MKNKERDALVDLLKGIGIISVVIGHSGILFPGGEFLKSIQFVYLYHLMIFFFVGGMTYKPEKYCDPYLYIGRQLKSILPLFVQYNFVLLLLHNPIANMQLLNMPIYSISEHIVKGISISIMTYMEPLCGALWFVPMFFVSKAIFSIGFQWAEHFRHRNLAHLLVMMFTAAFGIYTNFRNMDFTYHMQTSLLGVPIIYLGYLFRQFQAKTPEISKIFRPVPCLIATAVMYGIISLNIGQIDLSVNQIMNPILFYPVTIIGIFFCLCLAGSLQHIRIIGRFVSYAGSVSFHIMAQHFLVFKIFDAIYGRLIHADIQTIMTTPVSFYGYGLIYTILGVAIPMLIVYMARRIKTSFFPQ